MIIIKFAMLMFLIGLTLMLAMHPGQGPPVGGPIFYVARPDVRNPIMPSARINAFQATKRRNVWRVWFDGQGDPVKLRLYHDKVPVYEERMLWYRPGRLRNRWEVPVQ